MSGSVNKVILVGNLGKDPESHNGERGLMVKLRVATSESWKDKTSGERRERTEWHQVVIYNEGLAKIAAQYLAKGTKVYIEGQLQTRKWQDRDGVDRYSTEVVLSAFHGILTIIDGGKRDAGATEQDNDRGEWDRDANAGRRSQAAMSPKEKAAAAGGGFNKAMDDEIPFGPEWRA